MMRFNCFGIPFYVSYWTVFLVAFSFVTAGAGQGIILMSLVSTTIHEVGHLVFICIYRGKPQKIGVYFFEVKISSDDNESTWFQDLLITFAGIAANGVAAVVALSVNMAVSCGLLMDFFWCNVAIGLLNAFPFVSFDGGQLLLMVLSVFVQEKSALKIVNVASVVLFFPLVLAGIYILFNTRNNFSLLFVSVYLLSIFISKELR